MSWWLLQRRAQVPQVGTSWDPNAEAPPPPAGASDVVDVVVTYLQICCVFVTPTLTQHLGVDSDHTSQGQILRTLGEGTPEKGQLCEHL